MSNQGYKATFNHYRCMYVIVDSTVRLTYQLASNCPYKNTFLCRTGYS